MCFTNSVPNWQHRMAQADARYAIKQVKKSKETAKAQRDLLYDLVELVAPNLHLDTEMTTTQLAERVMATILNGMDTHFKNKVKRDHPTEYLMALLAHRID